MNIVERAARIIDPEAFTDMLWFDDLPGGKQIISDVEKAKKEFLRSRAVVRAIDVLRLALNCEDLKAELISDELDRWKQLGIPQVVLDDPKTREIITEKFSR